MTKLINYTLYQIGWFCCVLGAANGRPWSGMAAASALLILHVSLARRPVVEMKLALAAGLLGGILDSMQSYAGLLVFDSWSGSLAPPWIVLLWMQFATLLRFSLSYLRGRYLLGGLLAGLGGPLAFWIGSRLSAVQFSQSVVLSLAVVGLVWAAAFPFLLWLAARWSGSESPGRYRVLSSRVA
ncbi:MAG: DUF2878 domain-containing protein [Planctomycetota bacterium]|jgi:hypothetical protein